MILLMGTELAKTSVGGLVEPTVPEFGVLTTAVLVFFGTGQAVYIRV